jgi:hypothetical protein
MVLCTIVLCAQSDFSADKNQITKLMSGLSDHSIKVADVLDPSMSTRERTASLGYFGDSTYQLSLVPVGAIEINADGSATVPVAVRFKTATKELATQSTASFVKRDGIWYFANFGFVGVPAVLIVVAACGALVGISYASGVLLLRRKLLRAGKLDLANRAKLFIPIFWPSLFSRT